MLISKGFTLVNRLDKWQHGDHKSDKDMMSKVKFIMIFVISLYFFFF